MKAPSVFAQVIALALTTLVIAFAASVAVVALTPTPHQRLLTIAHAAAALQHSGVDGVEVSLSRMPIAGVRSPVLERALARALAVPPDRVRAVWDPAGGSDNARAVGKSVVLIGNRPVVVENSPAGFFVHYSDDADLPPDVPLPAFKAALHQNNGDWRRVEAADPWYAAWRLHMAAAFAVVLLILAAPVLFIALRIAQPIRRLAQVAGQTAGQTADWSGLAAIEPFPVTGPQEVRAAATAMNAMHRQMVDEARRKFDAFAAVAHDLRTPLTALRIRAETAPPHDAQRMIADIERMSAMITDVLDFLQYDARPVHLARLDLVAVLSDIVARRRELSQPVSLAEFDGEALIDGDPQALERAINNLIDNGLRYAGAVDIRLEQTGGSIEIHIDDEGPGLPPEALSRVFAPFERLETSRNRKTGGTGLGLAIVARIVSTHGGQARLSNRRPSGLRATLSFPAREPA